MNKVNLIIGLIGAILAIVGTIVGAVIGYYQAKNDFSGEVSDFRIEHHRQNEEIKSELKLLTVQVSAALEKHREEFEREIPQGPPPPVEGEPE